MGRERKKQVILSHTRAMRAKYGGEMIRMLNTCSLAALTVLIYRSRCAFVQVSGSLSARALWPVYRSQIPHSSYCKGREVRVSLAVRLATRCRSCSIDIYRPYFWNSQSRLSNGHTCRALSHREMQ